MILTCSFLWLLALVSVVEPYPFHSMHQMASPVAYNFDPSLRLPPQLQAPFYSASNQQTQISNHNNNAQQAYAQQPRFNLDSFRSQHHSAASAFKQPSFFSQMPIEQTQAPPSPAHQVRQAQSQSQPQPQPQQLNRNNYQQSKTAGSQPAVSISPAPLMDKDFLSTLQIIDTEGKLREFRDFGIGGNGNHPHEPELEMHLRNIFDTINKDLENAAFLPLDMNASGQQQLNEIIRGHQEASAGQASVANAQHYSLGKEIRGSTQQQPRQQQQQQQQPQQPPQSQQHLQQVGYAFKQPQQHQFQFLQPRRTAPKSQETAIRSPAQTLREAKKVEKVQQVQQQQEDQLQQRPIEQHRVEQGREQEIINQAPLAPAKVEQITQEHLDDLPKQPAKASLEQSSATKGGRFQPQPADHQRQELIVQQPYQSPPQGGISLVTAPIESKATQQTVEQGFDEEPAPVAAAKTVERDLSQQMIQPVGQKLAQSPKLVPIMVPLEKATPAQKREPVIQHERIEQHMIEPEEVRPVQQPVVQTIVQSVQATKSKKFNGWVPISTQEQQKAFEPQQKMENIEQLRSEDLGFDDRKSNFGGFQQQQQTEVFQPAFEQQEMAAPALKSVVVDTNDRELSQSQIPAVQQQETATKGGNAGKFSKFRKSINKLAASAKSKLNVGTSVQLQEEKVEQQSEFAEQIPELQQQREEVPVQQQEELLKEVLMQTREGMFKTLREQNKSVSVSNVAPVKKQQSSGKSAEQLDEPVSVVSVLSPTTSTSTTQAPVKGRKVRVLPGERRSPAQKKARQQQVKVVSLPQKKQAPKQALQNDLRDEVEKPVQKVVESVQQQRTELDDLVTPQQQETLVQQKEDSSRQQNQQEAVAIPDFPTLQRVEVQQPREPLPVQREDISQQQQERVEVPLVQQQEAASPVQQQREEAQQQQREEVQQQRLEANSQVSQQSDESPAQQQSEDALAKQPEQVQENQQKEEVPTIPLQQTQNVEDQQKQQQQRDDIQPSQVKEEIPAQLQQTQQEESLDQQKQVPESQSDNQQRVEAVQQQQQQQGAQTQQQVQEDNTSQQVAEDQTSQQNQRASDEGSVQQQELVSGQQQEETPVQQQQQQVQQSDDNAQQQQQEDNAQQPLQQQQQEEEQGQQREEAQQQKEADSPAATTESTTTSTTTTTTTTTAKPELPRAKGQKTLNQQRARAQISKSVTQAREEQQIAEQQSEDAQKQDNLTATQGKNQDDSDLSATDKPEKKEITTTTASIARGKSGGSRLFANQKFRGDDQAIRNEQNNKSLKSSNQRSSQRFQGRFQGRQRTQQIASDNEAQINYSGQQQERINSEGPLSANQLLNTYNPLQFEPERISSLNKGATESSSQNTNVNSAGESY